MIELTSEEEILLETLKEYHIGKLEAITSKNLRHIGTPRDIRSMVNNLRVLGYPICSGQNGYYYAKDSSELEQTMNFLKGYLDNIKRAHDGIRDTYYMMKAEEISKEDSH